MCCGTPFIWKGRRTHCAITAMVCDDSLLQYLSPLGLGTHQLDRRLSLAQQRQARVGKFRALQTATKALTYFKFRFLKRPCQGHLGRAGQGSIPGRPQHVIDRATGTTPSVLAKAAACQRGECTSAVDCQVDRDRNLTPAGFSAIQPPEGQGRAYCWQQIRAPGHRRARPAGRPAAGRCHGSWDWGIPNPRYRRRSDPRPVRSACTSNVILRDRIKPYQIVAPQAS